MQGMPSDECSIGSEGYLWVVHDSRTNAKKQIGIYGTLQQGDPLNADTLKMYNN
jgi:hypothetical protein